MKTKIGWLGLAGLLTFLPALRASQLAFDQPGLIAYDDGWQSGDNGGTGFQPWILSVFNVSAGHFMGNSTANGNGLDDGTINGAAGDGDVNVAGRAWGLWANGSATADGVRPFIGALSVGQSVIAHLDNGYIDTGGTVGVALQNSSGQNVWELFYAGGNPTYSNNDAGGVNSAALGFGDEGLRIQFTLTGAGTYDVALTRFDGVGVGYSGILMNPSGGQAIDRFRLFNYNAGEGASRDAFLGGQQGGGLQIIPEPAAFGLLGFSLLGFVWRRLRDR